jgi:hypothetical protein
MYCELEFEYKDAYGQVYFVAASGKVDKGDYYSPDQLSHLRVELSTDSKDGEPMPVFNTDLPEAVWNEILDEAAQRLFDHYEMLKETA